MAGTGSQLYPSFLIMTRQFEYLTQTSIEETERTGWRDGESKWYENKGKECDNKVGGHIACLIVVVVGHDGSASSWTVTKVLRVLSEIDVAETVTRLDPNNVQIWQLSEPLPSVPPCSTRFQCAI